VPLTEAGGRLPRPVRLLVRMLAHPGQTLRLLNPIGKARNTVILMVMQTKEAFIHMVLKRKWHAGWRRRWGAVQKADDTPLGVYFPSGQQTARLCAEETGGDAGNVLPDVLFGIPATAHIMGGAAMGRDAADGVVDQTGAVFGYHNLRVLDGSIIPGNLGVNPSLTILALTEHAMFQVPVWNAERAASVSPIMFSKPRPGQVAVLDGEGNLLAEARRRMTGSH